MLDLRLYWRSVYRRVFHGPQKPDPGAAAAVLAQLRDYACARPEQTDVLVMHDEWRRDPDAYRAHVERVRMYRHIQGVLAIPDEQVNSAEERVNEIMRLRGGEE